MVDDRIRKFRKMLAEAPNYEVWKAAALEALGSFTSMDLRPFAAGMTDEALGGPRAGLEKDAGPV